MQKVEISDAGENSDNRNEQLENEMQSQVIEKPLDPRAGRVNVELPQIPFDAANIVELLKQYRFHWQSSSKSRRQISRLLAEYVLCIMCTNLLNYESYNYFELCTFFLNNKLFLFILYIFQISRIIKGKNAPWNKESEKTTNSERRNEYKKGCITFY